MCIKAINIRRVIRRPFLLLEVMIALLLMALCLIPLLEPHYAMLQSDLRSVEESEIERVVQKLYANFLIAMYRDEVSWSDVGHFDAVQKVPIAEKELEGLPYDAYYVLRVAPSLVRGVEYSKPRDKSQPPKQRSLFLLEITYIFVPKVAASREQRKFSFRLFARKEPSAYP